MYAQVHVRRYPPSSSHKDEEHVAPWCSCTAGNDTFDMPYEVLLAAGMPPLRREGSGITLNLTVEVP